MNRSLLATVLLLVPLALTLPGTLRHEHLRLGPRLAPPGYRPPRDANLPLLAGMQARIPEEATIAFRGDRPRSIESGWVRWVAFVLAPRQVVEGVRADWLVVVRGKPLAGARHVWRYGPDWLVER